MPPATAGWQQRAGKPQPQIAIHRPVSRLFFFFLSLYLWWENNWTTPGCWKTYWNCIAMELGTLGGLFFFVHFCSTLCLPFDETTTEQIWVTISRIGGWGTNTKIIKTEISLHLNMEVQIFYFVLFYFILYIFFFHLLIFYFYSYLYSFFLFSIISLSLMPFQLMVD
jgi:hypothetical protein